MKFLTLSLTLLFTGCTGGVVNSLSDVSNSLKSLTNQTVENKVLVKNAYITEKCDGKSRIIKKVTINNTLYVKESPENVNWLNVFEANSKTPFGCIPKSITNYKEFSDSFTDLGGNTLELFLKTEKEQFKAKGFTKEERNRFSSKKGFTIEEENSRKKLYNYEYAYVYNYLSQLNTIKNPNADFKSKGGLK